MRGFHAKRWAGICACLLLVFVASVVPAVAAAAPKLDWNDQALDWHDYEAGLVELQRSGANGLLIFYADWCPTCKAYSKLFSRGDVVESLAGLVLIRVDVDEHPALSAEYDLDGEYVPRTFALDSAGRIVRSLYPGRSEYVYFLPADDPQYLRDFAARLKALSSSERGRK